MIRALALPLALFSISLAAAPTHREILIHFDKDRSSLTDQAKALLDEFLLTIEPDADQKIILEGHTDSDGMIAYNDTLSAARSRTVRDYLVRHGVHPDQVEWAFRGEHLPVASNMDESGMAQNRRVRILYTRYWFANTAELSEALRAGSVQHFTIDPSKNNLITGHAGATVAFRAHAFRYADGEPVSSPVSVEFTEALDPMQMVAFRLGTRSGKQLLETDGMVRVLATDETGRRVELDQALPMKVTMPADSLKARMELFISDSGTDWQVAIPRKDRPIPVDNTMGQPIELFIVRDLPVYKENQRGKPLKPSIPVIPSTPYPAPPPNMDRPWWGAFTPALMRAREQRAQAQADKRKQERDKRYQQRLDRYWADKEAFPKAMEAYTAKKAAWDSLKQVEYATWRQEVYLPALQRYDSLDNMLDASYGQEVAAWKARQDSLRKQYAQWAETAQTVTSAEIRNYVFTTTQLGWINCDRFYNVPEERKAPVIASTGSAYDVHAFVVFTGMRMLLPMEPGNGGEYVSSPVPTVEPAVIFAYTVKDGKAQLCVQPVVPGQVPDLEFKPSTMAELGKQLAELAGS
jgi:hypothetical protein